jgi:hypothetical protein
VFCVLAPEQDGQQEIAIVAAEQRKVAGRRYRNPGNKWLAKFIQEELFTFRLRGDRRVVRRDGAKTLTGPQALPSP